MKKITVWTMLISVLISLMYTLKINWLIETEAEFYRATASYAVSTLAIWCAYYYVRDYIGCKMQEENLERVRQRFQDSINQMKEDEGNKPE